MRWNCSGRKGEEEEMEDGGRGEAGGEDAAWDVLGSPGLPGKRDSNPTHGTLLAESGSVGLRWQFSV